MGIILVKNTQGSNRTLAPASYRNRIYFPGILSPSAEKCTWVWQKWNLVFPMLHSVQTHPKESPGHPLIARKILCEMLARAVFGLDSLGRCRMLREEKGTNEHLSCQSSLLLADPHASRITPFCQTLPDRSPQGELVPFDDVLRECEGTNNNILRAYQIFNAHVWEQEVFSLLQRQLLLDCPFCL